MINFRYHIVSLMAVFIALAVGIAVGVSLAPSVRQGLDEEAGQDRRQVVELRVEVDRLNALARYRDDYAQRVGEQVTSGSLAGVGVALVSMPDAPGNVVQSLEEAVTAAGGTVVREVDVDADVFDAARAEDVTAALSPLADELGLTDAMSPATRVGRALGYSVAASTPQGRDGQAVAVGDALEKAGLASIDDGSDRRAELVVVVSAEAAEPALAPELLEAHVELDVALTSHSGGVVVAGPNSSGIEGTDVLALRSDADAADSVSTVDVADLPSGVTTTVLAGEEQLVGRTGHYGALTRADAPLPTLPVR